MIHVGIVGKRNGKQLGKVIMANDGSTEHGNENFEQESKIMASGLFEATADVQTTLPVGNNPISLSDREQQVLFGIADGMSNREIAESMGIGIKTVESYRAGWSPSFDCGLEPNWPTMPIRDFNARIEPKANRSSVRSRAEKSVGTRWSR